jgi:mRNA interferase RelE/StbE
LTYEIEWAASALRELRKLDHQATRRILVAVSKFATDPRPSASRALSGQPSGTMRLRVGDYRVIYHVEDQRVVVTVVRVAHRREAYRDL